MQFWHKFVRAGASRIGVFIRVVIRQSRSVVGLPSVDIVHGHTAVLRSGEEVFALGWVNVKSVDARPMAHLRNQARETADQRRSSVWTRCARARVWLSAMDEGLKGWRRRRGKAELRVV
jgi:hypothetical protein